MEQAKKDRLVWVMTNAVLVLALMALLYMAYNQEKIVDGIREEYKDYIAQCEARTPTFNFTIPEEGGFNYEYKVTDQDSPRPR